MLGEDTLHRMGISAWGKQSPGAELVANTLSNLSFLHLPIFPSLRCLQLLFPIPVLSLLHSPLSHRCVRGEAWREKAWGSSKGSFPERQPWLAEERGMGLGREASRTWGSVLGPRRSYHSPYYPNHSTKKIPVASELKGGRERGARPKVPFP